MIFLPLAQLLSHFYLFLISLGRTRQKAELPKSEPTHSLVKESRCCIPCMPLMSLSPPFSMELRLGALRRDEVEVRAPALGEFVPVDDFGLF